MPSTEIASEAHALGPVASAVAIYGSQVVLPLFALGVVLIRWARGRAASPQVAPAPHGKVAFRIVLAIVAMAMLNGAYHLRVLMGRAVTVRVAGADVISRAGETPKCGPDLVLPDGEVFGDWMDVAWCDRLTVGDELPAVYVDGWPAFAQLGREPRVHFVGLAAVLLLGLAFTPYLPKDARPEESGGVET